MNKKELKDDKDLNVYLQGMLAKMELDPQYELKVEFGKLLTRDINSFTIDERKRYNELESILTSLKAVGYKCPKCGEYHNDRDEGYEVDGVKYPIYLNESKGGTMDGNYHDWDEYHKCEKCNTNYWFSNGAY